ncbi:MAG: molybdenum ABC transporter ATP-binding protein [Parvibaculaceae bacterium]|nr:molybdenum ABC transporter ATP-binding protein [Parvibaculaceae bacterium]
MSGEILQADLRARLGTLELELSLKAGNGTTAIVGPSGAGKTSLLRIIAGLHRQAEGRISFGDHVFHDSAAGIFLKPEKRRIGYVFQEPRLFPHMSVARNLDYGARRRGIASAGARDEIITLLGLANLLERLPHKLSGGEAQRVAMGRTLLSSPRLLLMDEPMANLDLRRRREIMPFLEMLHQRLSLPILYVSHNLDEVIRLADNVLVIDRGRVFATGGTAQVLNRPDVQQLLAGTPGMDADLGTILDASISAHEPEKMITRLSLGGGLELRVPLRHEQPGTALRLRLHARDIAIATQTPHGLSIRNSLPGRIDRINVAPGGQRDVTIRLDGGGNIEITARVTQGAVDDLQLARGHAVWALVKSVALASD